MTDVGSEITVENTLNAENTDIICDSDGHLHLIACIDTDNTKRHYISTDDGDTWARTGTLNHVAVQDHQPRIIDTNLKDRLFAYNGCPNVNNQQFEISLDDGVTWNYVVDDLELFNLNASVGKMYREPNGGGAGIDRIHMLYAYGTMAGGIKYTYTDNYGVNWAIPVVLETFGLPPVWDEASALGVFIYNNYLYAFWQAHHTGNNSLYVRWNRKPLNGAWASIKNIFIEADTDIDCYYGSVFNVQNEVRIVERGLGLSMGLREFIININELITAFFTPPYTEQQLTTARLRQGAYDCGASLCLNGSYHLIFSYVPNTGQDIKVLKSIRNFRRHHQIHAP